MPSSGTELEGDSECSSKVWPAALERASNTGNFKCKLLEGCQCALQVTEARSGSSELLGQNQGP